MMLVCSGMEVVSSKFYEEKAYRLIITFVKNLVMFLINNPSFE